MNNPTATDVTVKLDALEARAARYVSTPGPAGEVQQRASAVIADHMVTFYRRDGRAHHWEVEARGGHITFARTRAEAEAALAVA